MKSEKPLFKRLLPFIVVLLVLIVAVAIATPTIAYYIRAADEVSQDYTPGESTDPSFRLGEDTKEVKNVSIDVPDDGYPVYVRVAILVTWVRLDNGSVVFDPPVEGTGNNYILNVNKTDWLQNGAFYYCKTPIECDAANRSTPVLINSCTLISDVFKFDDTDCVLNVEIIVQTVQAIGTTDDDQMSALEDAWGVKF